MHCKIFIQAEKPGQKDEKGRPVEKMFSYDIEAETSEEATQKAKNQFELEYGNTDWHPTGIGMLQM